MRRPQHYHYPQYQDRQRSGGRRGGGQRHRDRHHRHDEDDSLSVGFWLFLTLLGAMAAAAWMLTTPDQRSKVFAAAIDVAATSGIARERTPQAGDHWGGCNDAREAGTAPIYSGEPGYREDMDGDGDGIACEPHY